MRDLFPPLFGTVRLLAFALLGGIIGCGTRSDSPIGAPPSTQSVAVAPPAFIAAPPGVPVFTAAVLAPVQSPAVQSQPPYLLHLPGIGGKRSIDVNMTNGFKLGGFAGDIDIYDWTENDPGIPALLGIERNHKEAKRIAQMLTDRFDKAPAAPIYITCHSGGGGLAIWALEALPERVKVASLVMMSPALSPTYDMTPALRHVTGKVYVFSSMLDELVLGLGCTLTGTIDGVKTAAAGQIGFTQPPTADVGQYAKIVSIPYQPNWKSRFDNRGDHIGGMTRIFAQLVLAPLVLSGKMPPEAVKTASPGIVRPSNQ